MIHMQITHIIKNDFFLVLKYVFLVIMGLKNVQSNFKIIGFVPYNPKKIINNLNFISINSNIFYTTKNIV